MITNRSRMLLKQDTFHLFSTSFPCVQICKSMLLFDEWR